jgi:hypothetical protein
MNSRPEALKFILRCNVLSRFDQARALTYVGLTREFLMCLEPSFI